MRPIDIEPVGILACLTQAGTISKLISYRLLKYEMKEQGGRAALPGFR